MKKTLMMLITACLIFGFAGGAAAADVNCFDCVTDPGLINRGCPGEQDTCYTEPFDFESEEGYCVDPGKGDHRYVFPICDCETSLGILRENDTVDIRLEILVNGKTGDNGAYWAEDVNSIFMNTYATEDAACINDDYDKHFEGPFAFKRYKSGVLVDAGVMEDTQSCKTLWPTTGTDDEKNYYRATVIQLDTSNACYPWNGHGYQITKTDDENNHSFWAIDIPEIRFDLTKIKIGDVVSVQVCLTKAEKIEAPVGSKCGPEGTIGYKYDAGGICGDCGCCCDLVIGSLACCDPVSSFKLVYPYASAMNEALWWYGMVITNLSTFDGEAEVTVYEVDGDTKTITVPVEANKMFITNNAALKTAFGSPIGDAAHYYKVVTDFDASGFMFIGNDDTGTAMGYLPLDKTPEAPCTNTTIIINDCPR